MPTNTYVALDRITVGTATPSVTFSNIPQTYTDLVIVAATTSTVAATNFTLRFGNGSVDTASNYSAIRLVGNGSSATSGTNSGTVLNFGDVGNPNTPAVNIIHIMNYTNTTTFKTILGRANTVDIQLQGLVGLWRKTPEAINIITIGTGSNNFAVGSTFSLYGISNAGDVSPKATGGDVFSDANYWYHAFTMSGNFVPNQSLTADVLQIAGGGGGGFVQAGGGGAGGLLAYTSQSLTAIPYSVLVGGGGAGSTVISVRGGSGSNSQFGSLTASAGGGGAGSYSEPPNGAQNALSGGSGGGGGSTSGGNGSGAAASPSGQGNAGGGGGSDGATYRGGGGGGGAGSAGGNVSSSGGGTGGNGGSGSTSYSTWATATSTGVSSGYAGGGGGGGGTRGTATHGGGNGAGTGQISVAGTANTGGGGGGGTYVNGTSAGDFGAAGGSGIVIVRYAK